jgi:hypothetical protein
MLIAKAYIAVVFWFFFFQFLDVAKVVIIHKMI